MVVFFEEVQVAFQAPHTVARAFSDGDGVLGRQANGSDRVFAFEQRCPPWDEVVRETSDQDTGVESLSSKASRVAIALDGGRSNLHRTRKGSY
ncbi:hypothetical protein VNO77_22614 [Canavalia gladiata]|uniref:Uncharacterized protein n=1 Tax=Canavalia gladiata TaxID=3824 RepID=A0AAN9Q861_CANGL